jgi:hypothetical protein
MLLWFNKAMIRRFLLLAVVLLAALPAFAQEAAQQDAAYGPPAPAAVTDASAGPMVIELFTTAACAFCPQADRLFADLIAQKNVIGLSCHVDYNIVKKNSLALPFCTSRQDWYEDVLSAGPDYTPQMVIQGRHEAIGYRMDDIAAGMRKAQALNAAPLTIRPGRRTGILIVEAPAGIDLTGATLRTYMMVYDRPHDVTIGDGRNKGLRMNYLNVVSETHEAGPWHGDFITVAPKPQKEQAGFALLVQDTKTGRVVAAGKYEYPDKS